MQQTRSSCAAAPATSAAISSAKAARRAIFEDVGAEAVDGAVRGSGWGCVVLWRLWLWCWSSG